MATPAPSASSAGLRGSYRGWWAAFALAGALLTPTRPYAQDDARTRVLRLQFAQGLTLEGAGRWADALERFNEVVRLRPTPNVMFHVALCHDRLGRLLKAEQSYRNARDAARGTAPEAIPEINAHLQDVDGRMPRVVLLIAGTTEGVSVRLDGVMVQPSKPLRVDPGPHLAQATRHGVPVAASAFAILERRTKFMTLKIYPMATESLAPASGRRRAPVASN